MTAVTTASAVATAAALRPRADLVAPAMRDARRGASAQAVKAHAPTCGKRRARERRRADAAVRAAARTPHVDGDARNETISAIPVRAHDAASAQISAGTTTAAAAGGKAAAAMLGGFAGFSAVSPAVSPVSGRWRTHLGGGWPPSPCRVAVGKHCWRLHTKDQGSVSGASRARRCAKRARRREGRAGWAGA